MSEAGVVVVVEEEEEEEEAYGTPAGRALLAGAPPLPGTSVATSVYYTPPQSPARGGVRGGGGCSEDADAHGPRPQAPQKAPSTAAADGREEPLLAMEDDAGAAPLGREPQAVVCRGCGGAVVSRTERETGRAAQCCALALLPVLCCALPLLAGRWKDTRHVCPGCGALAGVHRAKVC